MNQCQTSLKRSELGKNVLPFSPPPPPPPASINYHKRGVKTYEPVSNIAEEIRVGEKRAPLFPPPPHQLITTKGVWVSNIAEEIWVGENVPLPNFWDRGTGTQHVRLFAYFPTNASTTCIEMTWNLRKLFHIKNSISCDPFSIIQFSSLFSKLKVFVRQSRTRLEVLWLLK